MPTIAIELLDDGRQVTGEPGIVVGTLAPAVAGTGLPYVAALVNNDVCSLSYPLTVSCTVRFLTMADPLGWRVYRNSLCFLLAKAVEDCFPGASFSVEHSFGLGLYCSFAAAPGDSGITRDQLGRLETHMRELVAADLAIERRKIAFEDAVAQFKAAGRNDKLSLLAYRNPPHVVVYECGHFSDLAHGPLAPGTGVLSAFTLVHYPPGFVLHLPDRSQPTVIPPFEDQPHLFHIFQEHKEWGRILGVDTVGRLNEIIADGRFDEFVQIVEALHEKKVAQIADQIVNREAPVRLVLIAGPSSSGKTTFAKRLATQLMVNGVRTVTVATDDYFVGADQTPRDADGELDFEHIEAVDLLLFNKHLLDLIEGRSVDIPEFRFETKARDYDGKPVQLGPDQLLVVEGIHALNPRLTEQVALEHKFGIYVSALTQLSVDANNRISTTDNRLMRRIVRDHRFRGYSALETLRRWPSVRRGEKQWVFPHQRKADATFNSALDYELAVLKPLVEPLLMQVKPASPEYAEARRLTEFLLSFLDAPADSVPRTSILREYIGGSVYRY